METAIYKQFQGRRAPVIWASLAVIAVMALALLYLAFGRSQRIPGLVFYQDVGRGHDETLTFEGIERPPAGGVHYGRWLNCGIYAEPVTVGQAVHSLEHGAVWITYRPDLPAEQVTALQERLWGEPYVILSPFPGQDSPLILTAWAVQLELTSAEDERFGDFLTQYQQSPTAPEPGASCANGAGEPLS